MPTQTPTNHPLVWIGTYSESGSESEDDCSSAHTGSATLFCKCQRCEKDAGSMRTAREKAMTPARTASIREARRRGTWSRPPAPEAPAARGEALTPPLGASTEGRRLRAVRAADRMRLDSSSAASWMSSAVGAPGPPARKALLDSRRRFAAEARRGGHCCG